MDKFNYQRFVTERGRPLTEIHESSDEIALSASDSLKALELLQSDSIQILGGDILSERDGQLVYAYQIWGEQYHSLNWYCEKEDGESHDDFNIRAVAIARDAILAAERIAKELEMKCFVVFILQ